MSGHPAFLEAATRKPEHAPYMLRSHPHSTYLHLLGCTGLIGGSLFAAVGLLARGRSWHTPADSPYVDGTLFVLLTWLIGAVFDCYHLNGQLSGLFAVIVTLTLKHRLPGGYTVPEPSPARGQPPHTR